MLCFDNAPSFGVCLLICKNVLAVRLYDGLHDILSASITFFGWLTPHLDPPFQLQVTADEKNQIITLQSLIRILVS